MKLRSCRTRPRRAYLALGIVCYAPRLLAFPYKARFGETVVRSERPIPATFAATFAQADDPSVDHLFLS